MLGDSLIESAAFRNDMEDFKGRAREAEIKRLFKKKGIRVTFK